MKFETLRMMAQDYADRHKEPPSLPATIDTMAYAYQRICQGEDPWTAVGDFSNAWSGFAKHIRPDLVKEPLIKPEQTYMKSSAMLVRKKSACTEPESIQDTVAG